MSDLYHDPDPEQFCPHCTGMVEHATTIEMHRINMTIPLDGQSERSIIVSPIDVALTTPLDELPDGGTVASVNAGPIWVLIRDTKFDPHAYRQTAHTQAYETLTVTKRKFATLAEADDYVRWASEHAEHHDFAVCIITTHNMTEPLTITAEKPS